MSAATITILIGVVLGVLTTGVTRANWTTMSPAKRAGYDPTGSSLTGLLFGTPGALRAVCWFIGGVILVKRDAWPDRTTLPVGAPLLPADITARSLPHLLLPGRTPSRYWMGTPSAHEARVISAPR